MLQIYNDIYEYSVFCCRRKGEFLVFQWILHALLKAKLSILPIFLFFLFVITFGCKGFYCDLLIFYQKKYFAE